MPAPKFFPVRPRTTMVPPVMYSQPWSPTPSTTATRAGVADGEALARAAIGEERAAGRAVEAGVADDRVVVRARTCASAGGRTTISPPLMPLPT